MTDLQHITVPLVDPETGLATTVFYRYLRGLKRTVDDVGDDDQPAISNSVIYMLQSKLRELQGAVEYLESVSNLSRKPSTEDVQHFITNKVQEVFESNVIPVKREFQQTLDELSVIALARSASSRIQSGDAIKVISSNTNAAGSKTYICSSALTLTMAAAPKDKDLVNVVRTNGQVIIDGNGNNVVGGSTYTMLVDYESRKCLYSAELGEWVFL